MKNTCTLCKGSGLAHYFVPQRNGIVDLNLSEDNEFLTQQFICPMCFGPNVVTANYYKSPTKSLYPKNGRIYTKQFDHYHIRSLVGRIGPFNNVKIGFGDRR